jgi:hypothetical protein
LSRYKKLKNLELVQQTDEVTCIKPGLHKKVSGDFHKAVLAALPFVVDKQQPNIDKSDANRICLDYFFKQSILQTGPLG